MGNGGWKQGVAWVVAGIRIIIPCVLEITEHVPTHYVTGSLQSPVRAGILSPIL